MMGGHRKVAWYHTGEDLECQTRELNKRRWAAIVKDGGDTGELF